jgi:hypothetical protein
MELSLSVEPLRRIDALNTAGKNGLDMFDIAVRTCEGAAQAALGSLSKTQDLPDWRLAPEDYSDNEQYLIRSLEWVANFRETYECVSRMASRCITYFLCERWLCQLIVISQFLDSNWQTGSRDRNPWLPP